MAATPLQDAEIAARLAALSGWTREGGVIRKTFRFRDFKEAFAFMTRVALKAEAINHHPDWSNVYRTVDVSLSTHDIGGLSALDFQLAAYMDEAAGQADGGTAH